MTHAQIYALQDFCSRFRVLRAKAFSAEDKVFENTKNTANSGAFTDCNDTLPLDSGCSSLLEVG